MKQKLNKDRTNYLSEKIREELQESKRFPYYGELTEDLRMKIAGNSLSNSQFEKILKSMPDIVRDLEGGSCFGRRNLWRLRAE